MGADVGEASGHGPSEFSIVHDSIRRDREALFEGTRAVRARRTRTSAPSFLQLLKDRSTHHRPTRRDPARPSTHPRFPPSHSSQFIPSIEADSDDDGSSSDGELPIFFTSADPPSSSTARHHADPAISLAASETTTATTTAAPIFRDEGDELAAFERAASEALAREEERSARIVAAHLDGHHDEAILQGAGPIERQMHLDLHTYMGDDILVKVDRASMASSLEVRVPFLDHRVVELAARMPLDLKIKGKRSKHILKKAMASRLPQEVTARGKKGFGMPVAQWLRGPWKDLLTDTLGSGAAGRSGWLNQSVVDQLISEHLSGKRDRRKPLWTLLMFRFWEDGLWGPQG